MNIFFVSLGCDKNLVDSEVMLGLLDAKGYQIVDDETQADVMVINTCCFIHDAKEESIQTILDMARYKEEGRLKALVVTGCLAQRYKQEIIDEIPEVDVVLGTTSYDKIVEAVGDVSYKIGYEPELNTEKDSILFVLDPKPLELNVSIPSETEGGEAQNLHIEVKVSPVDGANYEVETTNLKFKIYVPEVSLGEGDNEPVALPGFVPATFDFELKKN